MEETKAPLGTASEDWAQPNDKGWALLPWPKIERHVYRLQKRIYRASSRGNVQAVHRLQQLLMRSESARLLAVRRVSQDNQGKKTPGVDGIASITSAQRLTLTTQIHPKHWKKSKPSPTRRVWIPKPGKVEKRPLGIPTMRDRACQALAKQALEPEWEAKFEPNSYGFRPGRSAHDAIEAIYQNIRLKPKYLLDADIKGCFDHIDHQALLGKLGTYPAMRRAIKAWLKAGVMEQGEFSPTGEGTPQGGVISPLLANIALHGLETALEEAFPRHRDQPVMVRYADDFVILHPRAEAITEAQQIVEGWLKDIGLELKPSKTRTTHTLTNYQGNTGFDFLGFNVRQFPVGKAHARLGFKTIITPSKEAVKRHAVAMGQIVDKHKASVQEALIVELNPVVKGWTNYYRTVVAKTTFSYLDYLTYQKLRRWAGYRHPNKGARWVANKYWAVDKGQGWTFAAPDGSKLARHSKTAIKRHIKVQGNRSPYDGDLFYWVKRLKGHPLMTSEKARLLKWQQGKCAICGLTFREGDLLETDHVIPRSLGGSDLLINKKVYHRHCHDRKTTQDGSLKGRGIQ
jgi:RNA-directed DNA polymerase